jgi:glycosyltransferase involved in cell wall biosynthesis
MSGPVVTVLIDTYNYGQYVEDAVDSVLAQEFPREQLEILVVDDGSTDDTPQRLEKYGTSIRYLRKPNGGQASAFNLGFAQSRGQIIALLDADDVWLPGKLRRVCETFERNPRAGMVYHRVHLWDGADQLTEDTYFVAMSGRVTESQADLLKYPMVGTSCLAFRREALAKLMPMPEALRTQADAFLTALIIFTGPVAAVPEFLAKYRIHGANLFQANSTGDTSSRIEHRMKMRAALLAGIRDWLAQNGQDPDAPNLQAYLKQWVKAQEADEFALRSPGRWRYARYLFEYPRIYGENMTFRHRLFSYLQAVGALVLGYHHVHLVEDARMNYKWRRSRPVKNAS